MAEGYIDIGGSSARIMMPIYHGEELTDTIVLKRKISGRGKEGFNSLPELETEFGLLIDELRSELGSPDIPPCSMAVKDSQAITDLRSLSVLTHGKAIARSDVLYLHRTVDLTVPDDYVHLHRILVGFRLDDGALTQRPEGQIGEKLTFYVMVIAVRMSELKVYNRLMRNSGIHAKRYIYDGLAHGLAAIRETDNKTCTVFDLGSTTTGVIAFEDGRPVFLGTSMAGVDLLSRALMSQLRCSSDTADKLKASHGMAARGSVVKYRLSDNKSEDSVDVEQFVNILRLKLNAVLQDALKVLDQSTWIESDPSYRHKIVMTGGGRSLSDLPRVGQQLLKVETIVARGSQHSHGENSFMACLGMWLYMGGDDFGEMEFFKTARLKRSSASGFFQWLKDVFS